MKHQLLRRLPTAKRRSESGCCVPSVPPSAPVQIPDPPPPAKATGSARFSGTEQYPHGLLVGLDVGSTTVKAVVVNPASDEIVWKDYQRHETRQPEKCLEFLERIETDFGTVPHGAFRVFMTGSGGAEIAKHIGAYFVQEVNAVSLAVEKLYPEVNSVVELGGQDAKIIVYKENPETNRKKKYPSMNDKCAGGTGAVIDKITSKVKIPAEQLPLMSYHGIKLHPVAGKCGVFAESDINSLQKLGVPADQLMASLFESIVQQNLAVLTRGHTLRPYVLLLGGPNVYIQGMQECWRHNIPIMWEQRGVELPAGKSPEELIIVPDNGQYFAALGAVEFGKTEIEEMPDLGVYRGADKLRWYLREGRVQEKKAGGAQGLCQDDEELDHFVERYTPEPWEPMPFERGSVIEAFIGLDGGSTSTKAVLLSKDKKVLAKAYQLSKGNPIEDTMEIFADLQRQVESQGCTLKVLGVGTTGYAKDILRDVLKADVALVETVAHTQAGVHYYPGTDVIVDVGGQDIKLIILKNGAVKDFKLNTQCSAGNGYFLQSTAGALGYEVTDYADVAFSADTMPQFGYGCAVFMQSDIVDFQQQGWKANEIMAGLAAVLPKNIWLYVAKIPNLPKLGRKFVLQGGTQRNLAAVKSQVDFIVSRFAGTGVTPEVVVHRHCGESGAIGCALEVQRLYTDLGHRTQFIGLDAVQQIRYRSTRNEDTRCYFCKNKCLRTFIDVHTGAPPARGSSVDLSTHEFKQGPEVPRPARIKRKVESKVPLEDGEQRIIIATCEKGTVEDVNDMRQIKKGLDAARTENPNLAEICAREVFRPVEVERVDEPVPGAPPLTLPRRRRELTRRAKLIARRDQLRIGMPRVLNMYSVAPFFSGYFLALGIPEQNLVWSDYTSEEMYKAGANRGSVDPCFPSKVAIPHIHNLLEVKHSDKRPLTHIFFPMVDSLPTWLHGVLASRACPTVAITPEAVHAAFIKEGDLFARKGIVFKRTFVHLEREDLLARQMYEDWQQELG
ncbi:MAG: CoA activase, partial [Acidobacteriota bacterium]